MGHRPPTSRGCGGGAPHGSCAVLPGKEREVRSLSTKQIPQPVELQLCWAASSLPSPSRLHSLSHTHTHSPVHWRLTLFWPQKPSPPGKCMVQADKGIWELVPGRSPVGWRWAHLKVSQTFGQCVFLRGLVTKDGLFPPRGRRDSAPSFRSLDPLPPGSLPSITLSANLHCPQGQQQGLSLRVQEWGRQQVPPGTGPWAKRSFP